jgi:hypothetical protein
MCFSEDEPGVQGPRRVSANELRRAFAAGWRVDSIEAVRFAINPKAEDMGFSEGGPKAWFAVLTRLPKP